VAAGRGPDMAASVRLSFTEAVRGARRTLRMPEAPPGTPTAAGDSGEMEVEIPAGVEAGARLRVPGAGGAHPRTGRRGDLLLDVDVEPGRGDLEGFRRDEGGRDVHSTARLPFSVLALGGRWDVPTVDGPVTLTVPPGTQGGERLRLRGRGVGGAGDPRGRGSQVVTVQPSVPRSVGARERALLEELLRLQTGGQGS